MGSSPPRVVVTGLGSVTVHSAEAHTFFEKLCQGVSGISAIEKFDTSSLPSKIGAEIKDFNPFDWQDRKESNRNDTYTHYAVAAAKQAVKDARINLSNLNSEKFGVLIGSGIGGIGTIQKQSNNLLTKGARRVSPFFIPSMIANMASGVVAIELGAKGPNFGIVSACASGTHAIGEALKMLRLGEADIMLAGGSEACVTELGFAGFCSMKAMSTHFNDNPTASSRPFEKDRDGFVMGEGSGVLVLETLEHAQKRGANIYCELVGYGATCDSYHITSPEPEGAGLSRCLEIALKDALLSKQAVDYINAHGTSTPYNDKFETIAFKRVFGERASQLKISSTKSMTGHLLGAAGGIEAIICAKVIETGRIPPTINYHNPDPECDLDYVPNQEIKADVRVAISDNLGFGGHNAAIVLKRFE